MLESDCSCNCSTSILAKKRLPRVLRSHHRRSPRVLKLRHRRSPRELNLLHQRSILQMTHYYFCFKQKLQVFQKTNLLQQWKCWGIPHGVGVNCVPHQIVGSHTVYCCLCFACNHKSLSPNLMIICDNPDE